MKRNTFALILVRVSYGASAANTRRPTSRSFTLESGFAQATPRRLRQLSNTCLRESLLSSNFSPASNYNALQAGRAEFGERWSDTHARLHNANGPGVKIYTLSGRATPFLSDKVNVEILVEGRSVRVAWSKRAPPNAVCFFSWTLGGRRTRW